MGNGFMSRPSSADSVWGKVEDTKDEELYQPIRNYYGEVVGWRERTESEKLERREINAEFAMMESEEEQEEQEEDQSDKSPSPTPTPPPPPPKKPLKVVIQESSDIEEEENPFNKSSDRTPSAKSVMVSPAAAPHSSRVKDKFSRDSLAALLPRDNNPHFYVCGPPGFIKTVVEDLAELGVPGGDVNHEFFGPLEF